MADDSTKPTGDAQPQAKETVPPPNDNAQLYGNDDEPKRTAPLGAVVGTPTAREGWFSTTAGELHPDTRVVTPDGKPHRAGDVPSHTRVTYSPEAERKRAEVGAGVEPSEV